MSFSNMALSAYYIKCGVADENAILVAGVSLGQFITLQAEARQKGAGTNSKAIAATRIAENIIAKGQLPISSPLWDTASSLEKAQKVVALVRAAALCRVAVSAYVLKKPIWEEVSDTHALCLRRAEVVFASLGSHLDLESQLQEFERDAERQAIRSLALGDNSGFFSKIFG